MRSNLTTSKKWLEARVFSLGIIYAILSVIPIFMLGFFFMIKSGVDPVLSSAICFGLFCIMCAGTIGFVFLRVGNLLKIGPIEIQDIVIFIARIKYFVWRLCFLAMMMSATAYIVKQDLVYVLCTAIMYVCIIFSMRVVFGLIKNYLIDLLAKMDAHNPVA